MLKTVVSEKPWTKKATHTGVAIEVIQSCKCQLIYYILVDEFISLSISSHCPTLQENLYRTCDVDESETILIT